MIKFKVTLRDLRDEFPSRVLEYTAASEEQCMDEVNSFLAFQKWCIHDIEIIGGIE